MSAERIIDGIVPKYQCIFTRVTVVFSPCSRVPEPKRGIHALRFVVKFADFKRHSLSAVRFCRSHKAKYQIGCNAAAAIFGSNGNVSHVCLIKHLPHAGITDNFSVVLCNNIACSIIADNLTNEGFNAPRLRKAAALDFIDLFDIRQRHAAVNKFTHISVPYITLKVKVSV